MAGLLGYDMTAVEAISDEERAELKETFQLFDRDNDGLLTARELGEAMRAMAQHPTEQEIEDIVRKPDPDAEQAEQGEQTEQSQQTEPKEPKVQKEPEYHQIDFDFYLNIMAKRLTVPEPDDQLLDAFRVFDKEGTGVISAADLRQIVTTMGERLTDEEVEEMIREADDDGDGQINYQEFTQLLLSS